MSVGAHRVEPVSRAVDPGQTLAALVADPLWMLASQRRLGELDGEDAGSPVRVSFSVAAVPIDGWSAGLDTAERYDPRSQVLEALVTGEPSGPAVSVRDRIDAGRRLAASLPADVVDALRAHFPLDASGVGDPLLRTAGTRFPDGVEVAREAAKRSADAASLGLSAAQWTTSRPALASFARWCTTTFGLGAPTWHAERLERRFELLSGDTPVLRAPAHTREEIDVADLELTAEGVQLADAAVAEGEASVLRIPTVIRFPGMPNDRYWEFEDARISLARIDAATHDLARLALVEFSTVYGNDWFTFPASIRPGTIARVVDLVSVDTFGQQQLIAPAALDAWALYTPSGPGTTRARLVVPATTPATVTGPVVEDVAFVRDENANLVWGLERVVTDAAGDVHDLVGEYAAAVRDAAALPADAELVYRLMTDVPEHWIPFLPVQLRDRRSVALVEAVLPRSIDGEEEVVVEPRSSVLQELRHHALHEEEVPRAGVVVRRRWQLGRSADGGRHTWTARSVSTGRGEGASGLEFDIAVEVER
ncbi:hypothetical protein [Microbacterium sp. NPDC058389]|uniref:hypothetical protein n=1 Tax=Microbacterium sp. NPDC058389 TaxID=3346475 RepID=UPI003661D8B0